VHTKSQLGWLKSATLTSTTTGSNCQTMSGHNSRRSAQGSDMCIWSERLWERKVL